MGFVESESGNAESQYVILKLEIFPGLSELTSIFVNLTILLPNTVSPHTGSLTLPIVLPEISSSSLLIDPWIRQAPQQQDVPSCNVSLFCMATSQPSEE